MCYYYQIKSPAVRKILNDNLEKRKVGLEKALAFADKEGVEVSSVNDSCYRNIGVCITNVSDEQRKFFKQNKAGVWTPKMNTKIGKLWAEKLRNLTIELTPPFPAIQRETGYDCGMVYDPIARTISFPKIVWIGEEFFLIAPAKPETKEGPVSHSLYEPKQKWELEKLIEEEKAKKE